MHPEYAVGAGTVVNSDILNSVAAIGVDYGVSPGLDESMVIQASKMGIPFIPGCATPSEILKAQNLDLTTVKLFPVECFGEPQILKLYESAFPSIRFLLTGALNTETFIRYLSCANVLACGGDFLVPRDLLEKRDTKGIADTINRCIHSAKEIRERTL
jgi:2-dehydro-3-deoxyphosphogluconate aldolase/(4S)-4-hydroxy-2-oxoglutarate aldolase